MLEDDIKALRRAVEDLTKAIADSTSLLTSAALENASQSEQNELAHDAMEASPLPKPVDPTDDPAPTMSDADLIALMLEMSRAGKKDDLRAKLAEYGVKKASDLKGKAREAYVDWLIALAERS